MTRADFGAAVAAYAAANGPAAAKAKLGELGYAKTADVPEEHLAAVATHLVVA